VGSQLRELAAQAGARQAEEHVVSIVMPAYNEADIIERTVREWHGEVIARLPGSELIVVDDCSTDSTGQVLEAVSRTLDGVRILKPPANGGHGKAVRFGLERAAREFVFQTDSDRQHVPEDFWKLWELRHESDFVMGVRRTREDGAFRKLVTRTMRLLNAVTWGMWIPDANCPFKLMRSGPMRSVLAQIPGEAFIPMVAVSILSRRMGYRVGDVTVTHLPRRGGQQSLQGMLKWMRVGYRCARELLRLRLSLRPRAASRRAVA